MFYYAQIDENELVTAVHELSAESTDVNYIVITQEQYTNGNLTGKYYNRLTGAFEIVTDFMGDTTLVKDGTTSKMLSTRLDNMEFDIEGKADENHTHAEYVTESTYNAGMQGKANVNHTHEGFVTEETYNAGIQSKANITHTHSQSDITGIEDVLSDKADINHTHVQSAVVGLETALNGKADTEHTHTAGTITGLAGVATSGSYNDLSDKPTIPTAYTHPATHPASMITGLPTSLPADGGNADTVDGKHASAFAAANHTHNYAAVDHNHDTAYADIDHNHNTAYATINHNHNTTYASISHKHDSDYAKISHTHAQGDITGLETALNGKANTSHTHSAATTTANGFMSSADKTKLNGIATGANAYTHPSYAAKASGLYKVTVDATGHVSGATAVAKADITALGIPSTNTTYVNATTSTAGLMSTTDKTKLDGIATGANKTTVDSALSSTSTNPVQNKVVNTALAGKASTSHNHNSAYIAKSLQMTSDTGDVFVSWSNQDVVAKIKALGSGIHTAYSKSGTTNNPKSVEAWRFMVHKTGSASYGWVMAFGSYGSMYTGYVDNGNWQGWKCIYDDNPQPLWTGAAYMSSPNSTPQTVTPSKKLSECRNGWLLLWSDYDKDTKKANDSDFVTTMIPKRNPTGGNWGGKAFYCDIPRYIGSNVNDVDTERRIIKSIYIHDNCIKGSFNNDKDERNDVVLRAVYEF